MRVCDLPRYQTVSLFGSEEVPVDVAFVLDSSSMASDLSLAMRAARGLVNQLRTGDRAALIDVKSTFRIPQPFTPDLDGLVTAVEALRAAGSTAMYDGLYAALREFQRERRKNPETRRQALVLLSDGLDNTSHVTFDDVAELARQLDVTIYTIAPRNSALVPRATALWPSDSVMKGNYAIRALARETGGLPFFPATAGELDAIYGAIGRELVSQYALGYVAPPVGHEAVFRRISVRVVPPAEGTARTRSGYLARRAAGAIRGRDARASTGQQ